MSLVSVDSNSGREDASGGFRWMFFFFLFLRVPQIIDLVQCCLHAKNNRKYSLKYMILYVYGIGLSNMSWEFVSLRFSHEPSNKKYPTTSVYTF